MEEKKERQSNIELLRILAAVEVILLHYNNPSIGGGLSYTEPWSLDFFIMVFTEVISICAVNLFVLISGYFLSSSGKRDLLKPIELIVQLLVIGTVFFLIIEIIGGKGFSLDGFLKYFTSTYWFVFVYAALYLISPFINICWKNLDEKGRRLLMLLSLGLFSVYPIIVDILEYFSGRSLQGIGTIGIEGSQGGYTIVNFILMYLIGCYLRDSKRVYTSSKLLAFLIIDIAVLMGWTCTDALITGKSIFETPALNYENPLVILEAVLLFLIFKNMKIKNNAVINALAKAAFSVYLIHKHLLGFFNIEKFASGSPVILILHILGTAIAIYFASFVIFKIYDLITCTLFNAVRKKWLGRIYNV